MKAQTANHCRIPNPFTLPNVKAEVTTNAEEPNFNAQADWDHSLL